MEGGGGSTGLAGKGDGESSRVDETRGWMRMGEID